MTKQTIIKYNVKGLDKLRQQIGDEYRARVGIIGDKAGQEEILTKHGEKGKFRTAPTKTAIDNVTLGIIQMFGSLTKNIPPRDFLDMPIRTHGRQIVQAMSASSVQAGIAAGDIKKVYALLGAQGEAIVQEAFQSSGWGAWPPNAPTTITAKGSDRPLIDTGQLRRAISSDVVKKSDIA